MLVLERQTLGKLHVKTADSGATADASADELVIEGSGNTGISILSGTSNVGSIYFGDSGTNWDGYIAYNQSSRSMTFGVAAGGGSVNIDSSGNVGIGTSNPSTMLHLSAGTTNGQGGSDAGITMTNKYDNPDNSWSIKPAIQGVSNTGLEIRDVTDSRSVMVFDGSGNVGIRTNSPDAPLDVTRVGDGTIAIFQNTGLHGFEFSAPSSTALQIASRQGSKNLDLWANTLSFSAGGSESMRIASSGNVGINESNPSHRLHINGGSNDEARVRVTNTANGQASLDLDNGEGYFRTYTDAGEYRIYDQTDGDHRLIIDTSGNVGIGTVSPAAELDVDGDIRGNSFNGVSTGTRNLLINGDMQIAQRSTNAVLGGNGYTYEALDRWGNYYQGNQIQRTSVDIASSGGGTPNKNAMRITRASSNGHLYTFQFLEGLGRLLRINTPFSISFKARASKSGNAVLQMRYGNSGSATTSVSDDIDGNINLTTSWQTFKYDNITLNRDYTNAGIWFWGVDTSFAAVGDWVEITDFQLELGPRCTPYEQKTEGMEFLACMRYYQKLDATHLSGTSSNDHGTFMGHIWATNIVYFVHHFNVPMRTGPTLKLGQSQSNTGNWFSGGSIVQTGSDFKIQSANQYRAEMSSTLAQTSVFTAGNSCWMRLYNTAAWVAFDAEI